MNLTPVLLALDAGGSKCDALLVIGDGTACKFARVTEPGTSGRNAAIIEKAVQAVIGSRDRSDLVIATVGKRQPWMETHARVHSLNEMDGALALAGKPAGVVVIAGTGARVAGRTRDGRELSLDGVGPILGDHGSGYQIGLLALQAAVRATQHPRHVTSLQPKIFTACGADVNRVYDLVHFSLQPHDRSVIAALARLVDDEARAGDPVAQRIQREAAAGIAETVRDLVDHLGIAKEEYVIVGTGSVATKSDIYWQEVCRRVAEFAPRLKPFRSPLPPVAGIALAGLLRLEGIDRNAVTSRLFETAPKITQS